MDPITQGIAAGLAVEAIKKIVGYGGRKIRKRFKPETPRESALKNAMTSALAETIQTITIDQDKIPILKTALRSWLAYEDVAVELSVILDSEAGAEDALDKELLINRLEKCWEPIGFDDHVTQAFVVETLAANLELSVNRESALQGEVNIRLLKELKGGIGKIANGVEKVRGDIQSVGKDISDRLGPKASDLITRYLRQVHKRSAQLDLAAIDTDSADESSNESLMTLSDVYIGLNIKGEMEESPRLVAASKDELDLDKKPSTVIETFGKHSRMILLGEPGGGKTTFVKYLCYCLAGYQLGDSALKLKLDQEGWPEDRMDLVPVPIILRDLAAWIRKSKTTAQSGELFTGFLEHTLAEWALADAVQPLMQLIHDNKALILLDGLDEVVAESDIRQWVMRMVRDIPNVVDKAPILVTCRVLSYKEDKNLNLSKAWHQSELDQFTKGQVDSYIDAWFKCRETCRLEAQSGDACQKLKRAVRRHGLKEIYRIPLLLTVMAIVHTKKGGLPDASVQLYEEVIDILLSRWDKEKAVGETDSPSKLTYLLEEAGTDTTELLKELSRVAYEAHEYFSEGDVKADDGQRTTEISETQLKAAIKSLHPHHETMPPTGEDAAWAEQVVYAMKYRAGLLIERADNTFYFPHRIFQEYLAARHLTSGDFVNSVMDLNLDRQAWRVVVLLAVDRQVRIFENNYLPLQLAGRLVQETGGVPQNDRQWRNVWLAGDCLLEIGLKGIQKEQYGPETLQKSITLLKALCENEQLTPRERAEAANVLGKLGDDRPGVGCGADNLPDILWTFIPGDKFTMGAEKKNDPDAQKDESPEFPCQLLVDKPYWISRYPITVKQFQVFIDDGGYENDDYWRNIPAGLKYRNKKNIGGPKEYGEPFDILNHPQVGVSWYEAVAFCNWLSAKTAMEILLPTEAQWERAARGADGRKYPWGDSFGAAKCNCRETGIVGTSAVGIFPSGDALENGGRIADLSGNNWEWCRTKWRKNYQNYESGVDDSLPGEETPGVARRGVLRRPAERAVSLP